MQQQQLLSQKQVFGKAFKQEAIRLVPLYKAVLPAKAVETLENSSPVCYAHVKGLREGFESDC